MNNTTNIAQKALITEANAIIKLSENLPPDFLSLTDAIINSKGRVIVAGVGKSGHIGRKI
tara:strand:- start:50 stop:229 length:180 start_codon:yes stop_codon:yes gene_type:complete